METEDMMNALFCESQRHCAPYVTSSTKLQKNIKIWLILSSIEKLIKNL